MTDILIKEIHLINPLTGFDDIADILISDGIIKTITKSDAYERQSDDKASPSKHSKDLCVIEGKGLAAAPGLIDIHSHFRDPGFTHKEDIYTGARAAAKGGYTTVVLMANTNPKVDNVDTLRYVIDKGKETDINVFTVANVTKSMAGKELTDMELLKKNGAIGFSDDGVPLLNTETVEAAFVLARKLNVPVSLHEENPKYITDNGINAGDISKKLGIEGSRREAEISMIERDIEIAAKTGADINIQHISTKEGVEIIRKARLKHQNIHAEATPHHFSLTEEAVLQYGTNAKMNPPLRTEDDRLSIIEGIRDDTIEIIATDHAPHSYEEKSKEITSAPSGIIGLETALALGITELVDKGYLSLSGLVKKMTVNPARLYGLINKYGSVEEGKIADIVIFDPNETWLVNEFASKSSNSPFLGRKLTGKVKYTIAGGKVIYKDF